MIQTNELRIGNWYKVDATGITEKGFARFDNWQDAGNFLYECSNIHITPKILECGGFHNEDKSLGKDYWKLKRRLCVGGWSEKFIYYLPYHNLSTYTGNVTIMFLHQFQNLYYDLTYKELEINFNDL